MKVGHRGSARAGIGAEEGGSTVQSNAYYVPSQGRPSWSNDTTRLIQHDYFFNL